MVNKIQATHLVTVGKSTIIKLLSDKSNLISSDLNRLQKALQFIVECIYGLKFDKLNSDLFRLVSARIIQNYPGLTFSDLDLAFSDVVIEKKQGTTLTRDEFMKPIEDFAKKKNIVLLEISKMENEFEEKAFEKKKEIEFFNESIEIYKDDLAKGNIEYSGTCFNAQTFASLKFAERFKQEEKNEIFAKAKSEYSKRMIQFEDDPKVVKLPPPHVNFIFSKLIVDHALANCFEI
jgi:enolase